MIRLLLLLCAASLLSSCYGGIVIVREIEVTRVVEVTATPSLSLSDDNVYIVQDGDTPLAIATRFGLTVETLMAANDLGNPDFVFVGQRLVIPINASLSTPVPTPTKTPTIRIHIDSPGNLFDEAVSITNDSNLAINLQGWRLERVGGPAYTFGSVSIFPGGSLWVHSHTGNDTSARLYWNQSSPIWSSGDIALLINSSGDVESATAIP